MLLKVALFLFFVANIRNSFESVLVPSGRIVHGQDVAEGQFPFYARITSTSSGKEKLCGGSLISSNWVLTAAQCVQGYTLFQIGLGSTLLQVPLVTRISDSTKAHVNPLYNPTTMFQDVALIQIGEVPLSDLIKPIDLPWWIYGYDDFFINLSAQTMGFGHLADGSYSEILQYINIETIPTPSCRDIYGSTTIGTDKICARGQDIKQNICYGDFGGPLIYKNATTTFQIGIASFFSVMPCEYGHPSAYTRLESTLKFVEYIIGWRGD